MFLHKEWALKSPCLVSHEPEVGTACEHKCCLLTMMAHSYILCHGQINLHPQDLDLPLQPDQDRKTHILNFTIWWDCASSVHHSNATLHFEQRKYHATSEQRNTSSPGETALAIPEPSRNVDTLTAATGDLLTLIVLPLLPKCQSAMPCTQCMFCFPAKGCSHLCSGSVILLGNWVHASSASYIPGESLVVVVVSGSMEIHEIHRL